MHIPVSSGSRFYVNGSCVCFVSCLCIVFVQVRISIRMARKVEIYSPAHVITGTSHISRRLVYVSRLFVDAMRAALSSGMKAAKKTR